MKIRGWVYVITNRAMPDLLKIGFTLKDPQLRADEFDTAGMPHKYKVEYEALVYDPNGIEKKVHKNLHEYRENREWFRCSLDEAVKSIREITRNEILLENLMGELERERELDALVSSCVDNRPSG
ncbi:MAG TPA: GIY-YIG nuclease family protein [Candidatus Bathyarchaeia archaeon]